MRAKIIHADATHKISRDKIRLMVLGTTDAAREFHVLGIQVTHETSDAYEMAFRALKDGTMDQTGIELKPVYLVSDADPAIHEDCRRVFGSNINIVMCCTAAFDQFGHFQNIGALHLHQSVYKTEEVISFGDLLCHCAVVGFDSTSGAMGNTENRYNFWSFL